MCTVEDQQQKLDKNLQNFEKDLSASFYSSITKEFCEEDNPPD